MGDIRQYKLPPGAALPTPAQWNGLIEMLSRTMIVAAGGAATVHGSTRRTLWVDQVAAGAPAIARPFEPRQAVAADFEVVPEDLGLYLVVGTGLVNSGVAPSNAGAPHELAASEDYIFFLEAEIDIDGTLTAITIDFATVLAGVPASPAGDAETGDAPASAYRAIFQVSTGATTIDWTTLVHEGRNLELLFVPVAATLTCDTVQLATTWL